MSAEDRRRVSAEMMARIDAVVSGHELQRSAEAAPQYVGRVEDRPLRFDEERPRVPGCGPISVPLTPPPHGRCPCGAHLEYHGSFLACPECESTFQLREDGWHGPPWTIEEDGRFFGRITGNPAAPDSVTDRVGDGTTAAFFEGVDRARRRFAPGGIVASSGLISADTPYLVGETGPSYSAAPETRTASQDASEGTLRGWLDRIVDAWGSASVDARLWLIALLDRDDR